jgi:hypothetical protein
MRRTVDTSAPEQLSTFRHTRRAAGPLGKGRGQDVYYTVKMA